MSTTPDTSQAGPDWLAYRKAAQAGKLSVLEVEFLMQSGPDWLDPPTQAEREAMALMRRRVLRERRFYEEFTTWCLFTAAAIEFLGRTSKDGRPFVNNMQKALDIAKAAKERWAVVERLRDALIR